MNKISFFAINYKYDECPVCFPRDSDASVAFISDLLNPRELKTICSYNEVTKIYSIEGSLIGYARTYKVNHSVSLVTFQKEHWSTSGQPINILYNKEIYEAPLNELASFLVDQDSLKREYATRVYKMRKESKEIEDSNLVSLRLEEISL